MKGPASWFVILCSGGNFAIAHYKRNELISHKSDKKYVQRKKAGKRQLNYDKHGAAQSVGSQMRRANEVKHEENILAILEEYKEELDNSDAIFLNAPGLNKFYFLAEGRPLTHIKEKVRTISLTVKKANFTEIENTVEQLLQVRLSLKEE